MRWMALFAVIVLFAACPPPNPVNPPPDATDGAIPPPPSPPPAVSDSGLSGDCTGACAVLASFGCPEAQGVDGGASCAAVCLNAAANGFDMKPACIVHAGTLEAVRACGTVKCAGK